MKKMSFFDRNTSPSYLSDEHEQLCCVNERNNITITRLVTIRRKKFLNTKEEK